MSEEISEGIILAVTRATILDNTRSSATAPIVLQHLFANIQNASFASEVDILAFLDKRENIDGLFNEVEQAQNTKDAAVSNENAERLKRVEKQQKQILDDQKNMHAATCEQFAALQTLVQQQTDLVKENRELTRRAQEAASRAEAASQDIQNTLCEINKVVPQVRKDMAAAAKATRWTSSITTALITAPVTLTLNAIYDQNKSVFEDVTKALKEDALRPALEWLRVRVPRFHCAPEDYPVGLLGNPKEGNTTQPPPVTHLVVSPYGPMDPETGKNMGDLLWQGRTVTLPEDRRLLLWFDTPKTNTNSTAIRASGISRPPATSHTP